MAALERATGMVVVEQFELSAHRSIVQMDQAYSLST